MGEVHPKVDKMSYIAANDADNNLINVTQSVAKELVMTKASA